MVKYVSKFSLPGGGLYEVLLLLYFIFHLEWRVSVYIYREYEDSGSGLMDIMLKFHLNEK